MSTVVSSVALDVVVVDPGSATAAAAGADLDVSAVTAAAGFDAELGPLLDSLPAGLDAEEHA